MIVVLGIASVRMRLDDSFKLPPLKGAGAGIGSHRWALGPQRVFEMLSSDSKFNCARAGDGGGADGHRAAQLGEAGQPPGQPQGLDRPWAGSQGQEGRRPRPKSRNTGNSSKTQPGGRKVSGKFPNLRNFGKTRPGEVARSFG